MKKMKPYALKSHQRKIKIVVMMKMKVRVMMAEMMTLKEASEYLKLS